MTAFDLSTETALLGSGILSVAILDDIFGPGPQLRQVYGVLSVPSDKAGEARKADQSDLSSLQGRCRLHRVPS